MNITRLSADIAAKTGVSKAAQVVLALLLVSNVLLAANMLLTDRSVRTQLVPPEISKSFWVDGKHLSPEYLEQMGEYIVMKFASVTPASIEAQNSQILKYVHPSVYGELSVRWKAASAKLKQDAISRHFFPREVRISEQTQSVAFIGVVDTWVGDKKVPNPEVKAYLVAFDYSGGSVTIKELRETNEQHPFAPAAPSPGEQN